MARRKLIAWGSVATLVLAVLVAIVSLTIHADRAGASKTISLRNSISGTECQDDEYLFILNGLNSSSDAPASITVQLSGGGTITVPVSKLLNKLAQYSLKAEDVPAGQTVVGATAVVPDGYTGNFVISHVPCASPSPSPSPSPEPSPSPSPSPEPSPSPSPEPSPSPSATTNL